jgi:hypothetical protein
VRLFSHGAAQIAGEPLVVPQAQRPRRPDAFGRLSGEEQRLQRFGSSRSTSLKLVYRIAARPSP